MKWIVVNGNLEEEIELPRINTARIMLAKKETKGIIITGEYFQTQRIKHLLTFYVNKKIEGKEIKIANGANIITKITGVIRICEKNKINFNDLLYITQGFYSKQLKILWSKFGVDCKIISPEKILKQKVYLEEKEEYKNLVRLKDRWLNVLENHKMYVAPLVARSNISDRTYQIFAKNENLEDIPRKEIAKRNREIPS